MRVTSGIESGLWPTPTVSTGDYQYYRNSDGTRKKTLALSGAVQVWPTPTQDSSKDRKRKYAQGGMPLSMAARIWPTPTVSMAKGATLKDRKDGRKRNDRLDYAVAQEDGTTQNGQLNPEFVEWLMGYPIGWTALKPLGIRSSRKSRTK